MIDVKTAARIAKERGLGLPDARALSSMAESEEDAAELADMFAGKKGQKTSDVQKVFDNTAEGMGI